MKRRIVRSIRTKLVVSIGISAAAAVAAAYFLLDFFTSVYRRPFFHEILSRLARNIGVQAMTFLTGILFFIVVFFLLTHRSVAYLEELAAVLKRIEKGDLDVRAEVKSNDELGDLASSINSMAGKLKLSIEEERKAERAKNELITGVSHDLRTPLTSVIGFLDLMTDMKGRTAEEMERFAGIAHKKALKLQALIDELFEFTRVSYGGTGIKPSVINLGELLEQLVEEFYPVFREASVECRLSILPGRLCIMADGDLMARLFENLINNAVRYGREGTYVDIVLERRADEASVKVTNYGRPIPEGDLPYVFDRFYRVECSRSRSTGGTGLGLAIAKSITDLHKGEIKVSSGPGSTCFEVVLPLSSSF